MKYSVTDPDIERKLKQFVHSNYAELLEMVLSMRMDKLIKMLKSAPPEGFQQVQGRVLELDDLIEMLKAKASGE